MSNTFFEHNIVSIDALIPYVLNSRTHDEKQVAQLASSIKEFGFTNPVLVDGDNNLIAGHGRVLAARKIGMDSVPAVVVTGLDDRKRRALVIADNKLALNADWDEEALRIELEDLATDFGELMGFSGDELADLLVKDLEEGLTEEDAVPDIQENPTTVEGDVWILGNHRLMCGDGTSIDSIEKLMDGKKATVVFTDPPYGIGLDKENQTIGKSKAYGAVLNDHSSEVAKDAFKLVSNLNIPELYFWGANHYSSCIPDSSCWIVWDKQGGKSVTYADCELCYTNINKPVRMFTHIWDGFRRDSEKGDKRIHPTQKPVALFIDIWDNFNSGRLILDLFGGSGSTMIACEKTGRECLMMELDPKYCDLIIKRWQDFTGQQAIHEETGKRYSDLNG